VVITDTFGRAWRRGVVNVAIGCAGLPSLVDLRGTKDATGRVLEATIVALADEVAAASGLAMGKADGVPVAILRGVRAEDPPLPASQIVRPRDEDLFRESPLQAIHARESARSFGPGEVPDAALLEAIAAACAAAAPRENRPWLFVAVRSGPSRMRLLAAMTEPADSLLADAPVLIVPLVRLERAPTGPIAERSAAERETLLIWSGAAIQSLLLALRAQGLASNWTPATAFHPDETLEALGLGQEWTPLGSVAVGPAAAEGPSGRPRIDPSEFHREA
jgi:coenzyme F420-0:L-glutamate ligase/coenzyme F420-1:gamma-L-glutamate ligase